MNAWERLTSPRLVGRDAEFARLNELAAHPPAIALVVGEPGVGKSRMVAELLAAPALQRVRQLVGQSLQSPDPFPLGPVLEALRHFDPPNGLTLPNPVIGALRPLLPELSAILPPSPESLGDRHFERHRVFRALREFLAALGPTVLVLEDLHWADPATAQFLRFLVADAPSQLAVVGTYRPEDLPANSLLQAVTSRLPAGVAGDKIMLDPLDSSGVAALVEAVLDVDNVSDAFATYLHKRTGGLPFAVEEALQVLKDRTQLVRLRGRWARRAVETLDVPPHVKDFVLERVAGLPEDARLVVRAAAVLGTPASESILREVADLSPSRATNAACQALEVGLLQANDAGLIALRHPIAAEAVHESIALPERRSLHLRAAIALQKVEARSAGRLASHFREAGETDQWVRYAEEASDEAASLGNDAAASEALFDVLSDADLSALIRARLTIKLAASARQGSLAAEAIPLVRSALAENGLTRAMRGELRFRLGQLLVDLGEATLGYQELGQAESDLESRPDLRARVLSFMGYSWVPDVPAKQHLHISAKAMALASAQPSPLLKADIMVDRASHLLSFGDPRGWEVADQFIADARGDPRLQFILVRACLNIGMCASQLGYLERAQPMLSEGRELSRELHYDRWVDNLDAAEAAIDFRSGRWSELEDRLRAMTDGGKEFTPPALAAGLALGELLLRQGKLHEAVSVLRPVDDLASRAGRWGAKALACGTLATALASQGNLVDAGESVRQGLDQVKKKGLWTTAWGAVPPAVCVLLELKLPTQAEDLVDLFAGGIKGRDAPAARATLAVCKGLIAEAAGLVPDAAGCFQRAERQWRDLGQPYEQALALESRGRCLLALGRSSGVALLAEASDTYQELGATWDQARGASLLRLHGAAPAHRRGRKGYGAALSPREAEVAHLAADGWTNREIAAALFLSPRTVELHVARAERKLGVASRSEVEAALRKEAPPNEYVGASQ
jgi:DNA-binding CsgD family transcriptional regulator